MTVNECNNQSVPCSNHWDPNHEVGVGNDPRIYGECIFYIGGCFEEDIWDHGKFYGHHPDLATRCQTLKMWRSTVRGWSSEGSIEGRGDVENIRSFLRQPFVERK